MPDFTFGVPKLERNLLTFNHKMLHKTEFKCKENPSSRAKEKQNKNERKQRRAEVPYT